MENTNNKSEKTIDNLKDESLRGEDIMGGGAAVVTIINPGPIVGDPLLPSPDGVIGGDGGPDDGAVRPEPFRPAVPDPLAPPVAFDSAGNPVSGPDIASEP